MLLCATKNMNKKHQKMVILCNKKNFKCFYFQKEDLGGSKFLVCFSTTYFVPEKSYMTEKVLVDFFVEHFLTAMISLNG